MTRLYASFAAEGPLLEGTRKARAAGLGIVDAYSPFAVHGLDEAMGLAPSRLTWVCFGAGLAGGTFAMSFQLWTSVWSWPINVGGKPFASVPAFIPVTFELTVLSAALVSAAAFFARSKLFPGKRSNVRPRVTDDRFVLVVDAADEAQARTLLLAAGAVEVGGDATMADPAPQGAS